MRQKPVETGHRLITILPENELERQKHCNSFNNNSLARIHRPHAMAYIDRLQLFSAKQFFAAPHFPEQCL
jgi:hypothetical protein